MLSYMEYRAHHTYAVINKAVGETPLAAIEQWRVARGIHPSVPLSYAGRLDPLASGKLLILVGDECKRQEHYRVLDKEYVFELLCGISTDTGDLLGMPERARCAAHAAAAGAPDVRAILAELIGTHRYAYPRYASRTVSGASLTQLSLAGHSPPGTWPSGPMTIYRIALEHSGALSKDDLAHRVAQSLDAVSDTAHHSALGNRFRIPAITPAWDRVLRSAPERASFPLFRIRVVCASGTYIRSLAPYIAQRLGTTGLAASIERTEIGRFVPLHIPLLPPSGFWLKTL